MQQATLNMITRLEAVKTQTAWDEGTRNTLMVAMAMYMRDRYKAGPVTMANILTSVENLVKLGVATARELEMNRVHIHNTIDNLLVPWLMEKDTGLVISRAGR